MDPCRAASSAAAPQGYYISRVAPVRPRSRARPSALARRARPVLLARACMRASVRDCGGTGLRRTGPRPVAPRRPGRKHLDRERRDQ